MRPAPGEIRVWTICLDEVRPDALPPLSAEEQAREARFIAERDRRRYSAAHAALRAILSSMLDAPVEFSATDSGKPFLKGVPEIRFSLSHSHEMAMVGVALDREIGVDIERMRVLPDCLALAERFFPASESAALFGTPEPERQADFYLRWTRIEARLKATGVGLYGCGTESEGEWMIRNIDAPPGYAAAVAAPGAPMTVTLMSF